MKKLFNLISKLLALICDECYNKKEKETKIYNKEEREKIFFFIVIIFIVIIFVLTILFIIFKIQICWILIPVFFFIIFYLLFFINNSIKIIKKIINNYKEDNYVFDIEDVIIDTFEYWNR